jgi:hypothetical protein
MPVFAAPVRLGGLAAADTSLAEARESLAYWESRAQALPRHALRRRREARDMAARWQVRVAEAECAAYGRGLLGALVLLAAERRLPEPTRQAGRRLARRATQAAVVVAVAVFTLLVATAVAAAELLATLLRAIS